MSRTSMLAIIKKDDFLNYAFGGHSAYAFWNLICCGIAVGVPKFLIDFHFDCW